MHGNVDGIHAHTDSYTHAKSHTLTYTHTHTQSFCSRTGRSPKSICLWYTLVLKLVALSTKILNNEPVILLCTPKTAGNQNLLQPRLFNRNLNQIRGRPDQGGSVHGTLHPRPHRSAQPLEW
jgi:hypothetical protein